MVLKFEFAQDEYQFIRIMDANVTPVFQLLFEILQLFLVLPQKSILRIFIDNSFIFNVLGPIGVPKGADWFIEIVICRADIGNLQICMAVRIRQVLFGISLIN